MAKFQVYLKTVLSSLQTPCKYRLTQLRLARLWLTPHYWLAFANVSLMFTIFCNEVGDWCEMTDWIIVCHIHQQGLLSHSSIDRLHLSNEHGKSLLLVNKRYQVYFICVIYLLNMVYWGQLFHLIFHFRVWLFFFLSIRPVHLMLLYISSPHYNSWWEQIHTVRGKRFNNVSGVFICNTDKKKISSTGPFVFPDVQTVDPEIQVYTLN